MIKLVLLFSGAQLTRALRAVEVHGDPQVVSAFVPGRRGIDFFSCPRSASVELDRSWAADVGDSGSAVLLAQDEPGLEEWIAGLDSRCVVGVRDDAAGRRYAGRPGVWVVVTEDAGHLTRQSMRDLGLMRPGAEETEPPGAPSIAEESPFALLSRMPLVPARIQDDTALAESVDSTPQSLRAVSQASDKGLGAPGTSRSVLTRTGGDEAGGDRSSGDGVWDAEGHRPAKPTARRADAGRLGQIRSLVARATGRVELGSIPDRLAALDPLVVAVASRKGGVGKTASAAGIAVIGGMAAEMRGGRVALVDANIGNPAAWGDLDIPTDAATVRACISRLNSNSQPPLPAYANTPGLACYREDRDQGEGYSADEIRRLGRYLTERHSLVVIDLPNRLPGMHSAEAEVTLHWLNIADVLVVPTDAGPEGVQGAREFLADWASIRRDQDLRAPSVIPFLGPSSREVRSNARLRSELAALARETVVVNVPRDERAVLALWTERSITEVSAPLRDAYIALTSAVLDVAAA